MGRLLPGAAAGILAAAFGVAAAELLAAATRPSTGPLIAVGGALIDATPTPIKELAVRELGTHDKPVLLAGIGVVLTVFAGAIGVAARRYRWAVPAGAGLLGLAGAGAALSRPAAGVADVIPALVAAAVAGVTLWWLSGTRSGVAVDRRRFLRAAVLVAGGAVLAEAGALGVERIRGDAARRSREAVRLPPAADPAKPLPAGVGPGFTTPNADFYRVDTALSVPRLDPDTWSLSIHGMVSHSLRLSFADLLHRPLLERDITLNCVSNEVGGPYIGTARWLGVPLAPLLREAGINLGADQLVARSADGMTIGTPLSTALDGRDTMLVLGMNGQPLPLEHGFPVRMLTPGLYGYAGACKWLTELELTTFDRFDAYWVKRGWAADGPVKTASRIDRPQPFAHLAPGRVTVAGVAWAQRRGIRSVEISVDNGPFSPAELLPTPSIDTWTQWRYTWQATPGPHSLTVRGTDRTGSTQTKTRAAPFPSGATGWQTISVTVG
ncbi:molybdopterin-dependent oxidoreductase [Actinoplanes sp. TBRC 11911]|uniref:molybdopterin-dependent oxidoreductase n=1 Tax=Actinoplanes sp. TBRC 11911 TaxID=2729386 RepID=UPI00145EB0ED|nr:molybdopterin-dependent oxidoreductase [Actinoplanes sp. TBRC 11911]NMO52484.1 molybdopterin-dependent oxidoreductase [Actinoplanes sp. TBRC 11911]